MPRTPSSSIDHAEVEASAGLSQYHFRLGWLLLAVFGSLGLMLEALHGWKLQSYVGVTNSMRREMWTLSHAHGTLLSLVHIAYASTLCNLASQRGGLPILVSRLLSAASVLMPLGFFLGGLFIYEGDPGLGILLVPVGATALITSGLLIARHFEAVKRLKREPRDDEQQP